MEVPEPYCACFRPCQSFQSSKVPGDQWNLHRGNQLLKSLAVTRNPPSFTLKLNTRKQERTKGKMAFCAMSECWWEGHSLNITKNTENQTAFTRDKTNTVQEDRAPLLHTRTSDCR